MFDVCIIGGGAAGLMLAHSLPASFKIAVLTKSAPDVANSTLAQGGIAASLQPADSPELHVLDTLLATAEHASPERVDILAHEGQIAIRQLMAEGLPYDKDGTGEPLLGIEGAHSTRRILHSGGDQSGKMLMAYLMKKTENRIQSFPRHQALELLVKDDVCRGVIACDGNGDRKTFLANHIVLATGGIGALYSHTSNSPVAEGDGLSLAYRAGAILEDLEFVQFHPTILTVDGKSKGLLSEAVRGEGALLVNSNRQSIMKNIHPLKELAPRDIVARAIERHWQEQGAVFLDARMIHNFDRKFPAILKNCQTRGFDPANDLLPVRPGAHFHMGGVKTDENGETNVKGLYAIGENASTSVHGANRLASNSLLEAVVFAKRLAANLTAKSNAEKLPKRSQLQQTTLMKEMRAVNFPALGSLRLDMTRNIGILRNKNQLEEFLLHYPLLPDMDLEKLSNEEVAQYHRLTACSLVATAAFLREESRGAHFREDSPSLSADWHGKTIEISKDGMAFNQRNILSKETV